MKQFILTHPKLQGQIVLQYNDAETLQLVDMTEVAMQAEGIGRFLQKVPTQIAQLWPYTAQFGTTIVESTFEISFDVFWKRYNKKINRIRALKLWDKLNTTEQIAAYYGIPKYDAYLKKESWRSKADPETYLRNKYWENEYK